MATCLITGANRGIGLEYCRQLQARGEAVVAVCRTPSPELEALGVRIEAGVDLTAEGAVARLVERLAGLPIDVLIHNAGILEPTSLEDLDVGSMRRQFEVNAVAPLRLTRALLGQLPRGAKLILMTSRMGSIEDNSSGGCVRLPHVEGGALHGRQVAGHRPGAPRHRRGPAPSGPGAHPHDRLQ